MDARLGRGWFYLGVWLLVTGHGCTGSPGHGNSGDAAEAALMDDGTAEVAGGCGASLASFSDGSWELGIDRVWDPSSCSVQFPTDPMSEEDYEPVADGQVLTVVVSDDASKVAIGTQPVEGSRNSTAVEGIQYDLDEGTFAGGRLVIWEVGGGLQSELTIYGSGVPIVSSERGPLCPVR
jgi:hypothetical protein